MFPAAVAGFEEIIAISQGIDFSLQQFITSVVIFTVAITIATIQAKHENEMLSLREMIKKSLLLRESPFATPLSDPDATPKAFPSSNSLPKTTTERWNQADLGYFKPHLNRVHGKGEIVLVGKNVYYKIIVLFVQGLQSLVTF